MKFLLCILCFFLISPGAFGQETASPRPPNIILITVDDLGWADIGALGSTWYETPDIDQLAADGMLFTNAYAAGAICSPSRSAIMTGQVPARTGITDWIRAEYQGGVIPENGKNPSGYEANPKKEFQTPVNPLFLELDAVTIAEVLKEAGYVTGHIGKWHLGPAPWGPEGQGFDENHGGGDFGEPPSYFDPYFRPENKDWKEPQLLGLPNLPARQTGEYLTDREAETAVDFIRRHKDVPFFLNLSHYAVHTPIQAKPDMIDKYRNKPVESGKQKDPTYAAMVESVNEALAEVMAELDALGMAENTVVIFTSDNGGINWKTSNAPLKSGKGSPYEGGIRIPTIVRWPGVIEPGSVSEEPVSGIDWLPTFAGIAGVDLAEDQVVDGENLVPIFKGEAFEREALYWHFPHYRSKQPPFSIVRKGDWKLIRFYGDKSTELYNLADDLSEQHNLAEEKPELVAELQALLDAHLKDTNAKMPIKNSEL